jgi:hypothetical protein
MKHFFFFLTLMLMAISSKCQLDKKHWLVGGTGSFFSYKEEFIATGQPALSGKLREVNILANVGYFLFDKLAAGLRPGIASVKSRGANTLATHTENIAIYVGPFVRYYIMSKEKQFNILVDGSCQFGSLTNFGKGSVNNASIMAGSEMFFNSSVGIEFLIGYLYQKRTIDDTQTGYSFLRKGLHASIGFQIHLTKK